MNKNASRAVNLLREFLIKLPRAAKSTVAFAADLVGLTLCVLSAFWLLALGSYAIAHVQVVALTVLVSVFLAWRQGMYRSVVRYMGLQRGDANRRQRRRVYQADSAYVSVYTS